jgi:hypothetical protein
MVDAIDPSISTKITMSSTATITATESQKLEAEVQPSDVEAQLVYWKQPDPEEGKLVVLDFTSPQGLEETWAKNKRYDSTHDVTVHDVRGSKEDFNLDEQGWTYVKHAVPTVKDWTDEAHLKEILIPESEKLVLQM